MKRVILIGCMLLSISSLSYAQDDIYSNGPEKKNVTRNENVNSDNETNNANTNNNNYYNNGFNDQSSSYNSADVNGQGQNGNYSDQGRSYQSDEYVDYDDANSYATRIHRFDYPFYNMGYYSTFYNPYWYDPFWVDPLWGYNPWYTPGITIGVGFGGWGYGCWGYNTWVGYPAFYGGWGLGFGYGFGYYPGFYGAYYPGFYGGYYGGGYYGGGYYGGGRTVAYGPRGAGAGGYHTTISGNRPAPGSSNGGVLMSGQRIGGFRTAENTVTNTRAPQRAFSGNNVEAARPAQVNNNTMNNGGMRSSGISNSNQPARRSGGFFQRLGNNIREMNNNSMHEMNSAARPSYNNNSARPSYNSGFQNARPQMQAAPQRMSAPAPSMSAPQRSFGGGGGFGGGHSGGGGFSGGHGGGGRR